MIFDYSKLNGKIKEKCGTQGIFALKIGMSERSLSLKLNNKRDWRQREIFSACDVLDIPLCNADEYFFTLDVQY